MRFGWTILRTVGVFDTYAGLRRFARPTGCRDTTRSRAESDRQANDDGQVNERHDIWLDIDLHVNEHINSAEPDRGENLLEATARRQDHRDAAEGHDAQSSVHGLQESGPVHRGLARLSEPRLRLLQAAPDRHDHEEHEPRPGDSEREEDRQHDGRSPKAET